MKRYIVAGVSMMLLACGDQVEGGQELGGNHENIETTDSEERAEAVEEYTPIDMNFRKIKDVPEGGKFSGNLFDCHHWKDMNGDNYFIRSLEQPEQVESSYDGEVPEGMVFYSQFLHAYHYIAGEGSDQLVLKRDLNDFIKECEFDINVKHLEAIELNDADEDNFGEITFGYYLACRSDVSSSTFKVFTFENGEKYAIRGSSVAMGYGGDYEPGEELKQREDFLEVAESYWNSNNVEFE